MAASRKVHLSAANGLQNRGRLADGYVPIVLPRLGSCRCFWRSACWVAEVQNSCSPCVLLEPLPASVLRIGFG